MLAALTRLGYDTVQDVMDVPAGILSKEMNIPLCTAEIIFSSIQRYSKPHTVGSSQLPTQAASSLVRLPQKIPINYAPMDRLLDGGVSRGRLLEISGPPGCPKEALLLKVVLAFVEVGQEVIFLETQNMVSPATIHKTLRHLPPDRFRLVRFLRILSLTDFMIFIHGLVPFLEAKPATGLLVVNSISYLFQSNVTMTASTKNMLLSQVKDAFTRACVLRQLTIATTSQMATKMLKPDGTPGVFDDGCRGVMQPALGNSYVPCAKSDRVVVIPGGRTNGTLKLIATTANGQPCRWIGYDMRAAEK
ncbi:hypothetical protein APHAL10511_006738 [Amanita phalloides]|nr:hypothetical protein APHAL10511_006738 [Amanita phalloides]